MKQPRARLLVINDPHPMRVEKELAAEIGLNESILFLQIEFLISISRHEQDGRLWTYQTLQDLHDNYFPWWSVMTISRIIKALQKRELLIVGNFNKSGFDRTQWFALNEEGISRLRSVQLQPAPISQNDKWISQNGEIDSIKMINRSQQIDTTIPETTTETTQSGGVANTNGTAAAVDQDVAKQLRKDHGFSARQIRDTIANATYEFTPDLFEQFKLWRKAKDADPRVKTSGGLLASYLVTGNLPDDLPPPPQPVLSDEERLRDYLKQFNETPVSHATYRSR